MKHFVYIEVFNESEVLNMHAFTTATNLQEIL